MMLKPYFVLLHQKKMMVFISFGLSEKDESYTLDTEMKHDYMKIYHHIFVWSIYLS
jgi:hypothetical protein